MSKTASEVKTITIGSTAARRGVTLRVRTLLWCVIAVVVCMVTTWAVMVSHVDVSLRAPLAASSSTSTTPQEEHPDTPELPAIPTTTIAADSNAAAGLKKAGVSAQRKWLVDTARSAGMNVTEDEATALMYETCSMLQQQASITTLSTELAKRGLTDEQAGTFIAASMVAGCPDAHVVAVKKAPGEPKDSAKDKPSEPKDKPAP